jgi:hypothetical protein
MENKTESKKFIARIQAHSDFLSVIQGLRYIKGDVVIDNNNVDKFRIEVQQAMTEIRHKRCEIAPYVNQLRDLIEEKKVYLMSFGKEVLKQNETNNKKQG